MFKRVKKERQKPPEPARPVTIDGKAYVQASESTIEQDDYYMRLMLEAGIDPTMGPGETHESYARRVFAYLCLSEKRCDMISCLLVEEGTEWTRAGALQIAERFRKLKAPDKEVLNNLTLSALIGFFESGMSSLPTSRTASAGLGGVHPDPRRNRPATGSHSATGVN